MIAAIILSADCRQTRDEENDLRRIRQKMREAVDVLSEENFGLVEFGVPEPWENENVAWIISRGREAIPFLVEALESGNPVKVGYAAYCLELMRANQGEEAALKKLKILQAIKGADDYRLSFAVNCLRDYLRSIADGRDHGDR